MKVLTLKRLGDYEWGTPGVLIDSNLLLTTLERRWLDNRPNESCIPNGEHLCKRTISPKFGETFEVTRVPNRTDILFHRGNLFGNSLGCILVGAGYGKINNQWGITDSGAGFTTLYKYLAGESEFKLIIKSV